MLHVDRFVRAMNRQSFDRVPLFYDATPEMTKQLENYLSMNIEEINENLFQVDRKLNWPSYRGPELKTYDDGTMQNIFGVRTKEICYGQGSYTESVYHPMKNLNSIDQIFDYNWPKSEWIDTLGSIDAMKSDSSHAMMFAFYAIGWASWEMRGMSTFLEDLLLEPKLADHIICRISDFVYAVYYAVIEKHKKQPVENFKCILIADDWATQDGLLISPETFNCFFRSHYRRIIDLAHSAGLKVEFHCCGSVLGLIPLLIDIGVDILNPIQTTAKGMDPLFLKNEYGDDLCFSGGVDVQKVLPFYTAKRVEDEVKLLLDTLGQNGGYIFGPSHSIQVGTPPENIVAMYKAAHEYYGLKINI